MNNETPPEWGRLVESGRRDQADGLASGLISGLSSGLVSGEVTGFTVGAADPLVLLQAPTNSAAARINRASNDFMGASSSGWGEPPP